MFRLLLESLNDKLCYSDDDETGKMSETLPEFGFRMILKIHIIIAPEYTAIPTINVYNTPIVKYELHL